MQFVYTLSIRSISLLFQLASLFHPKARRFVAGRKGLLKKVEADMQGKARPVWVHCASLGEFEQGRPVIEAIKKNWPQLPVVVTFFSPSGYEIRKNYPLADHVWYLPWDTASNAREFVSVVNPAMAIFVKYEFWLHYSLELSRRSIPLLSISSIFRGNQLFFKPYGSLYRGILKNFSHFFVQNEESVALLKSIGINAVTRAGDTRFDRVRQIVSQGEEIPEARAFKGDERVFVAGSCWPEDMDVLTPLINENHIKFILAPHEISDSFVSEIEKGLQVKSIRFSKISSVNPEDYQVLIIDNIGMLSRLYRYGEFAFIGGAYGKGLHNILEAACYGVPILFGNRTYGKFQEAVDLINRGGAFAVADFTELKSTFEMLNAPETFLLACDVTRTYVEENLGATEKIMNYCRNVLTS